MNRFKQIILFCLSSTLFAACQVVTGLSPLGVASEDSGVAGSAGMISPPGAAGATPMEEAGKAGMEPAAGSAGWPMVAAGQGGGGSTGGVGGPPPCELREGSECNWLDECGCRPEQHCQVRGAANKGTCVARGPLPEGAPCKNADQCAKGTCDQHVCRSYCSDRCDAGRCLPATGADGKPIAGVNVCSMSCQIGKANICLKGTTCQVRDTASGKAAFCVLCMSELNEA